MVLGDVWLALTIASYDWKSELIYIDRNSTTGAEDIEAKENVRRTVDAIATTDLEHGTGFNDHRELEEHGKLHCSHRHATS